MTAYGLGKRYPSGKSILRQGDEGNCMFVVQSGTVEIVHEEGGSEVILAEIGPGEFFGEMALFAKELRSATVRAKDDVQVLTVDKRTLLGRIQKDPSLAFRMLERMSSRIRELDRKFGRICAADRRDWDTRPESPPEG